MSSGSVTDVFGLSSTNATGVSPHFSCGCATTAAANTAGLGRKADALREGARAVEILPVSRDAVDGPDLQEDYAYVEMLVGETEAAVRRLAYLLSIPSDVSVLLLRVDPLWDPLRGDPRFQRLVAAPAS